MIIIRIKITLITSLLLLVVATSARVPGLPSENDPETNPFTEEDLRAIFDFIRKNDENECLLRTICEMAADPNVVEPPEAEQVTKLMMSLDDSDPTAPWMVYRIASATGLETHSRTACRNKYADCRRTTEDVVEVARGRIEGADE